MFLLTSNNRVKNISILNESLIKLKKREGKKKVTAYRRIDQNRWHVMSWLCQTSFCFQLWPNCWIFSFFFSYCYCIFVCSSSCKSTRCLHWLFECLSKLEHNNNFKALHILHTEEMALFFGICYLFQNSILQNKQTMISNSKTLHPATYRC